MLNLTPVQDWHRLILEMLIQAVKPISPQRQPNIRMERLNELEAMGCVSKTIGRGKTQKTFVYAITEKGIKYHQAMTDDRLISRSAWADDADLAVLYLAYGDAREAMPVILDCLNNWPVKHWDDIERFKVIKALRTSENGYARMIVDSFDNSDFDTSWVKPASSLTKKRIDGNGEAAFKVINFQLSPLAEDAFKVIEDYLKKHNLRTHERTGVASNALVNEYALFVAACLITGKNLYHEQE